MQLPPFFNVTIPNLAPELGGRGGFSHEKAYKGDTDEWFTPPYIFEALGLRFHMDLASPEEGPVPWIPADVFVPPSVDGLVVPLLGRVWCNPPYGPMTKKFIARIHEHGSGVFLAFNRTDADWFQSYGFKADAICYLGGRVQFVTRDGTMPISKKTGKVQDAPGAGSVLFAWDNNCVDALVRSDLGTVAHRKEGIIHVPTNPVRYKHPGNAAVLEHGWKVLTNDGA